MQRLNQRPILHLTATINNIVYLIGTLRFQMNKELSYFLVDPRDPIDAILNCDNNKMESPLEHTTWHKDRMHFKRKDNSTTEELLYSNGNLLYDKPIITPLYIESIYFDNIPRLIQFSNFIPWQGSQTQEILKIHSSNGFSIIFILIPASELTHSVLMGLQFEEFPKSMTRTPMLADLVDLNHRASRINLWAGWDMIVIVTPFLCRILSPVPDLIKPAFRLPNYKNVSAALTDLITQANNHKSNITK